MRSSARKYDFDFLSDKTNRFIPFILGFLIYSVVITLMSSVFSNNLTQDWSNTLNGRLTIEFQTNVAGLDEELTQKQQEEITQILSTFPGIKSARKLSEADILKILEPWLKSTAIPDDFPFPVLFDVETEKGTSVDLLQLSEKLSKISPNVKIHDHANWYAPILKISNALFFFAISLSILIFLTVCATIIFITKKTLYAHQHVVKILQLIGATNSYIASQFRDYYLSVGSKASVLSVFFSLITVAAINYIGHENFFDPSCIKYLIVGFVIPIFTTILIMITAQKTVVFFLNNDTWID